MAQELDVLNFAFIALGEYDGRHLHGCLLLHMVQEDLIGEFFQDSSCKVQVFSLIVVEP